MSCNKCHSPMTQLDPREITDPQPSRYVPRWRCDEKKCPAQGEVVEEGKGEETAVSDFTAHINGDDERAAAWQIVFDSAAVPLRSPIPHLARLPGRGEELVYLLDIEALTADQRGRLVTHIADKFNIPAEEVDADLDTHGCPILAEHVTVSIANPWRWL